MRFSISLFILSAYQLLLGLLLGLPAPQAPAPAVVSGQQTARFSADTRTLEFVENKGQWPHQVKYAADIPTGKLFLQPTCFTYVFHDPAALEKFNSHGQPQPETTLAAQPHDELRGHAYSVTFEGATPTTPLTALEPTAGLRNYYLGDNPARWGSGARGFRKVTYQALYPGVDLALYEYGGKLKYDLHLTAGTATDHIKLRYDGVTGLKLTNGHLQIQTSVGTITEQRPVAFQMVNGQRVEVPCHYTLTGNVLGFQFPKGYNLKLPLVIDPVVVFSTFSGSSADNWGFTATYDSQGNMYSGGIVFNTGFPASTGAFKTTFSGSVDIGILKFRTNVTGDAARLYATYLGGSNAECPHSMVVNAQNQLLILSSVGSSNFPTSLNAFDRFFGQGTAISPLGNNSDPNYSQGSDLAITTLSEDGRALIASTFLGGSKNDGLLEITSPLTRNYGDQFRGDIITDPDGFVYVASSTASNDFPAPNGFRNQAYSGSDAIVCKLTPALNQIIWSSYYGGEGEDAAYSIQLDTARNVYIAGGTTSTTLPNTTGGLHPTARGDVDGFVVKIDKNGDKVLGASYLGTSSYDQAYFLQLDVEANVYVYGQSLGGYPVTADTYSNTNGKQFIHKLTPDLKTTLFSTVFGSGRPNLDISPTAFLVDDCERIYVCGWGGGANVNYGNGTTNGLQFTSNAVQKTTDGGDFYLMQLSPNAASLEYATFYGGLQASNTSATEHVDGGTSRFDRRGFIYQAVCGGCQGRTNFPIPPGAHYFRKDNESSNCNNAAFKFDFQVVTPVAGANRRVCTGDAPIILGGTPAGGIWSGNGVSLVNSQYVFTPSQAVLGNNTLTYTIPGTGQCTRANNMVITVNQTSLHTIALQGPICASSAPVQLQGTPAGGTFKVNGTVTSTFSPGLLGPGQHTVTYSSNGSNGICGTVTKEVEVLAAPAIQTGPDTVICPGSMTPFQLRATPAGGIWTGAHVSATGLFTPPQGFTGSTQATYTVAGLCTVFKNVAISVAPTPVFRANLTNGLCFSNPQITGYTPFKAVFANQTTNATRFAWDFGDGSQSTEQEPQHVYERAGTYKVTLTTFYGNGCEETRTIAQVVVEPNFLPNIITPNGDNLNETFFQKFSCLPTEITIFNRWGKQVHYEKVYQQSWNGGKLSDGTYFYLLKDEAGNTAKGWVEIVR
ncbi:PKD domain-containing protein [Rufibacter ruber]|uniref:DUF7948 domain-containing protein n=1 Tax=Rufibacter ruber TaxID=1783499 RepID=UPI000833A082|nr:PKD domain-containing protein [Rufibacter ruber]